MTVSPAGTISSAPAIVLPLVSGRRSTRPSRGVPQRQQVEGVRAEHGLARTYRGHPPPATTSRRPPGRGRRSATHRCRPSAPGPSPSGHRAKRTGGAPRSARRRTGRPDRGGPAGSPKSRNHTCFRKPAGSAHRVYQNPEPSWRQVTDPPIRFTCAIGSSDDLPGAGVVDVQRPVLGAVLRQETATLLAVRGRHEEVDGGLARRVDDVRIHHHPLGRHIVRGRSAPPGTAAAVVSAPSARRRCLHAGRSCWYAVLSNFSNCSTRTRSAVRQPILAEIGRRCGPAEPWSRRRSRPRRRPPATGSPR